MGSKTNNGYALTNPSLRYAMTCATVLINMSSIHCFSEARGLVKITNVSPHVGIVNDTLSIVGHAN